MTLSPSQQSQLESIAIDFVFAAWQKFMAARQRAVNAGIDPSTLDAAMKVADAQLQTVYADPLPPHSTPPPTQPPAAPDPTVPIYPTLDLAKAAYEALSAESKLSHFVGQLGDGTFRIWTYNVLYPAGITQVWPTP